MITKKDIQNLANLARIRIEDSEADSLTSEIDSILEYVKQVENISTLEVEGVPIPRNVMRDDVVTHQPDQYTEAILSNAPSREGNQLKVKKILG